MNADERAPEGADALLDFIRLDEMARLAELAASYWRSIALAADRGDALTVLVHLKQATAVAREALTLAGELQTRAARLHPAESPS
jgi:hypothetical protein